MVRVFVAVTDWDWFDSLRQQPELDEVNFWQPGGGQQFRALEPGELFLFKLHAPRNYIAGGGIYFRSLIVPMSLAWQTFGMKNGAQSLQEMRMRIAKYRRTPEGRDDFKIGCRILVDPIFLPERQWLPVPESWSRNIVVGKTFSTDEADGRFLWDRFMALQQASVALGLSEGPQARFGEPTLIRPRLGQGAFRIAVTEAYGRRCAVTGERTLPVLEASHIRPYAMDGPHIVPNGLLLRRDIHTLFDLGYATVAPDRRFEVSHRIKEEYENGRDYYAMSGRTIATPDDMALKPAADFLEWHNDNVFLG